MIWPRTSDPLAAMELLSINQAIQELDQHQDSYVYVTGILQFEFENVSINHWPKAERQETDQSALWIYQGQGALTFNESALEKWAGKRVVIGGTLLKPNPITGAGHFGLYAAGILATRIELFARWPLQ